MKLEEYQHRLRPPSSTNTTSRIENSILVARKGSSAAGPLVAIKGETERPPICAMFTKTSENPIFTKRLIY
uniref:Uncharacterized protein n=1 Tax=Megaselia scalaris TaxID=36166 RepID=T1H0K1_MEGSC